MTRGSDERDQSAEGKAQQGSTTDAGALGHPIPEFQGAARREVLAEFQKDPQEEHRKARRQPSMAIAESDHRQH